MKKIVLILFFAISGLVFAEEKPLVCAGKVSWMNEQYKNEPRHFYMALSSQGDFMFGDAKTIDIDRKNKTIKLWTTGFQSFKSQAEYIKSYGQRYSDFGYRKDLKIFDFQNKKIKFLHFTHYTCNGDILYSSSATSDWDYIIPDSYADVALESLKQKYGL